GMRCAPLVIHQCAGSLLWAAMPRKLPPLQRRGDDDGHSSPGARPYAEPSRKPTCNLRVRLDRPYPNLIFVAQQAAVSRIAAGSLDAGLDWRTSFPLAFACPGPRDTHSL